MKSAEAAPWIHSWQWKLSGWINLAVGLLGLVIFALTMPLNPHYWWLPLVQLFGTVVNFIVGGYCLGKAY